jgi:hypothetical protein
LAIVVVGGSAKDIGKTALVCAMISGLSEFGWTAVKITGHSYELGPFLSRQASEDSEPIVWEETVAGQETDTARYLAAGARRALLITRRGPEIPIDEIRAALKGDRNIIFESNQIIDAVEPDVCIALLSVEMKDAKPSFSRLMQKADALVCVPPAGMAVPEFPFGLPRFRLRSLDRLSPELEAWLRLRLDRFAQQDSMS